MATKKTTAKKTAKKAPAKKSAASGRKDAAVKKQTRKGLAGVLRSKTPTEKTGKDAGFLRRPDANLPPTAQVINTLTNNVLELMGTLDRYAANMRALDRQRHNGVGLRRQGFIDAALRISSKFPEYFPHWLNIIKFRTDIDLFNAIRSLVEVCRSLEEKAWNINVEASDMIYTNALEYYAQVQDAAKRRVDSAESIYAELKKFFVPLSGKNAEGEKPTEKKLKRDVDALLHGKKDGKIVIENVKPKLTGGKRAVIDETFKGSAAFKDTAEGEIED